MNRKSRGQPLSLLLLMASWAYLGAWAWRRCPDLRIDFGDNLYIAWQLSLGRVLYRDIAWLYGPLSTHLDALVFRLAGPGLGRLLWLNLALVGAVALVVGGGWAGCSTPPWA